MNSGKIPVEWLPNYTYSDYEQWEGAWELIYGIPYAMSPSPKRKHQRVERKCLRLMEDALVSRKENCNCEVYHGLDWIVDESTVVRPDVIIVCGVFEDDFLRFPPSLIVEITSKRTQMADRNVKYKLYESQQVPYYIIADPARLTIDIFQLKNGRYQSVETTSFALVDSCAIVVDLSGLWP